MGISRTRARLLGLSAVAMAAVAGPAAAQQQLQFRVQIGRMGEVSTQEAGPAEPPRPGNIAGMTPVTPPRYLTLGPDIDGTPCRQFGIEFRAVGLPPDVSVPVVVQLHHPQWTRPDGQSGTVESNPASISSDRWSYSGYTLEEDWSLVGGEWRFEITQGPRILATATFNVTVEPGQTVPKDGCSAPTS